MCNGKWEAFSGCAISIFIHNHILLLWDVCDVEILIIKLLLVQAVVIGFQVRWNCQWFILDVGNQNAMSCVLAAVCC